MKKIKGINTVIVLIALFSFFAVFTACDGSGNTEESSSGFLYDSLEEYADSEEVQEEASSNTNEKIKCEIYAEDEETLVMKYTYVVYVDDDVVEEVASRLYESFESQNDYFAEMRAEIMDMVNVENPSVKLVYCKQNGDVFAEYTYSSENYSPVSSSEDDEDESDESDEDDESDDEDESNESE